MEKIKTWLTALTSFVKKLKLAKFPLWLWLVVCLVAALFTWLVSCSAMKASVDTAVVGSTNYRGHDYLVFRAQDTDATFSVVHDPDCPCHFVEPSNFDLSWELVH